MLELRSLSAAMMYEQSRPSDIFVLAYLLLASSTLLFAQPFYSSTSKLPTSWVNQPLMSAGYTIDGVSHNLSPVLLRENTAGSIFVFGFYCIESESRECTLGVLISTNITYDIPGEATMQLLQLVWSANRNDPVQVDSTLQLSEDGDLSLQNADGTLVWSSHTGGKSVVGMNLTESGNLVLFGKNKEAIWQSFDHPTDTLLLGQKLMSGQRLISSVSASNQSEGLFYISIHNKGLAAFTNSHPPQGYYFSFFDVSIGLPNDTYLDFTSNSLEYYNISSASRFMQLGIDGHLKVFQAGESDWEESADVFSSRPCDYPMACGTYGVCLGADKCSCPEAMSGQQGLFIQKNFRQPNLGCSLATPISCSHSRDHSLMELNNTYYFAFLFSPYVEDASKEDCENRCLNNCSCKAALFAKLALSNDSRKGRCLLLNDVFSSVVNHDDSTAPGYNTILYLKVQLPHANASRRKTVILASSLSAAFGTISIVGSCLLFRKLNKQSNDAQDDFLEHVPGMPARYSYEELRAATADFSDKLGEGGFGSVYEGELSDGTKIAVKCLDSLGRIRDSFLVEVKAIGSIQHVSLVKLMGFCFEKSHRLLVYEYMANRSLDGWIFSGQGRKSLPWDTRKRIISEIAKGLAYLHEDCNQKIIHLDIKPQNILLDHNFNAKIGDFGLSKLMEKDQSRVITTMRGTPGYLAPEWLSSVITEKVDVYSFGIVMLEIICGRKNLDWSKAEEDKHLLSLFKNKAEEGKLEELADESTENMEEAVEMMGIAAWCLQGDFTRRPSMSIVVKVLEGLVEAETNLNYDFLNPTIVKGRVADILTEVQPSALSGPR